MPTQTFALNGKIQLSVRLGHGSVIVRTDDTQRVDEPSGNDPRGDSHREATVELTAGPGGEDLLARTLVELNGTTLTVHAPRQGGLADLLTAWRGLKEQALDVVVSVPAGTDVKVATFTAPIRVSGRAGTTDVATASGAISLDEVEGDLVLRYGSADSTVEHVTGSVVVRSGTGNARFGEIDGDLVSGCGSGRLDAAAVRGTTKARAGAGEAHLGAVYGDVDLASGSGAMSIGLPAGVTARLDVTTASGTVQTDLPIEDQPASKKGAITVRARTGSGDVRLFRAAISAA